jgi:LSD1 subclass zinc finger protein
VEAEIETLAGLRPPPERPEEGGAASGGSEGGAAVGGGAARRPGSGIIELSPAELRVLRFARFAQERNARARERRAVMPSIRTGTCNAIIAPEDIRAALRDNAEALARYERLQELAKPGAVECPSCSTLLHGDSAAPSMTCSACKTPFCFSHGLAHRNATCADFDRAHAEEFRLTEAALAADKCKKCPKCGVLTFKYDGCNHVRFFFWFCLLPPPPALLVFSASPQAPPIPIPLLLPPLPPPPSLHSLLFR